MKVARPAIDYYRLCLQLPSPFDEFVDAKFDGALKRLFKVRVVHKRADALPATCLQSMLQEHLLKFKEALHESTLWEVRAAVFSMVGFLIIGREMDLLHLRAHQLHPRVENGKK